VGHVAVPKGTIYALNPLLDVCLVPPLSRALRSLRHFTLIRIGLTVAALSPLVLLPLPATLPSVIAFVLLLTAGDVLYNPRLSAYAMAVAPTGLEGTFAGLSAAVTFLAELPAGLVGGVLLERHCSQAAYEERGAAGCDARALFGSLGAFAALTPLVLWALPWLLREPSADVSGECEGREPRGGGGGVEAVSPSERELCATTAEPVPTESDGDNEDEDGGSCDRLRPDLGH
jgi:hypothetical protein